MPGFWWEESTNPNVQHRAKVLSKGFKQKLAPFVELEYGVPILMHHNNKLD